MLDMEHIEYMVKEIQKNSNKPYQLSNEELVNEYLPEIQKKIPQVQVFKTDIRQWIVITEKAKKRLSVQLSNEMEQLRSKASEISRIIEQLSWKLWKQVQPGAHKNS